MNESEKKRIPASSGQDTALDDEIIELGSGFDFDGFQVVRREFFAHTHEPSITFNDSKVYVNSACLLRFPSTDFVQILINRKTHIMAVLPCPEGAKDSFAWCTTSKGKRKPKQVNCRLFFAKVADMMGWDPSHRYKLLGKLLRANGDTLIAFDLNATEVYRKTHQAGSKPKTSRIPIFPLEWQDQFGLPFQEHRRSMQIDIFDGYAVYSIRDNPGSTAENAASDAAASQDPKDPSISMQEVLS